MSVLNCRRGPRKDVAKVEPDRVFMCIFRRAGGDKPGITKEVGVLEHELERTVLSILEEGLD